MEVHAQDIEGYTQAVLSGERVANKFERLAVERQVRDLAKQNTEDFPYVYEPILAERVCSFAEKFQHVKGKWALRNERIILEPWQKWCLGTAFAWVRAGTGFRRFNVVFELVPRKNGKSIKAAIVGLYCLAADGEYGAEVYCGATNQKQAMEVFRPAKKMAVKSPAYRGKFMVQAHAQRLERDYDGARMEPVIGKPGDGASPSCAIIDEYHEHEDDTLLDTMITGQGAREQPLNFVISTAGDNLSGPCYQMQKEAQAVLEGTRIDEQLFAIIYTIDADDDWTDPAILEKANPNFGVSVGAEWLRQEQRKAIQSPRKQNRFRTKHLNEWVGAREAWLNMVEWNNPGIINGEMTLDSFAGEESCLGGDLSEVDDLTASVHCFRREIDGVDHYYLLGRYYATEAKIAENELYQEFHHEGHLELCDGDTIDYGQVEEDIEEDAGVVVVGQYFYDPTGAAILAQRLEELLDIEAVKVPQSFTSFTAPMREFARLLRAGRIHHDGNKVLAWCMSNVIAKTTRDGKQTRPVKGDRDAKIDGAVAALLAFIGQFRPEEEIDDQDFCDVD